MARTVVSVSPTLVQNPTADATLTLATAGGTAVDPTNGHEFVQSQPNGSGGLNNALPKARKLLIVIDNTFAGAKTVTLKAPDFAAAGRMRSEGPNHRAASEDLVLTCPEGLSIFTTELGRWLQPREAEPGSLEGSVFVDYEAAMTGDITILALPDEI